MKIVDRSRIRRARRAIGAILNTEEARAVASMVAITAFVAMIVVWLAIATG